LSVQNGNTAHHALRAAHEGDTPAFRFCFSMRNHLIW